MNVHSSFPAFGVNIEGMLTDHSKPLEKLDLSLTVVKIAIVATAILLAVGLLTIPIGLGVIGLGIGINFGLNICKSKFVCALGNKEGDLELPNIESSSMGGCSGLALEHSAETEQWRAKMIASAEHNIILSGNYCGGSSFIEFLKLIEERMKEKPDLKVVLISSPKFLDKKIQTKLKQLKTDFPLNFSLVKSPDIWHIGPGLKKSTNHTKCMVIDYGKYFILGGSGIKDNFVQPGLIELTRKAYIESMTRLSHMDPYDYASTEGGSTFLDRFMPGAFRDQDFIFKADPVVAKRIFTQSLLLAHRWEVLNQNSKSGLMPAIKKYIKSLFKQLPQKKLKTITTQLLQDSIPDLGSISTELKDFSNAPKKVSNVAVRILCQGPEDRNSVFAEEVIKEIKSAKERVHINHMYFHPTDEVLFAIRDAIKKGVKVEIISCGEFKGCTSSHHIFGPRNKHNYLKLISLLTEEEKKNLKIYEFQQTKIGNHKKVIVVDDTVIAGSSNLGYKSLVTSSDHEINFVAKSRDFADKTLEVFDIDKRYSMEFDHKTKLSWKEFFKSYFHRLNAPLIG